MLCVHFCLTYFQPSLMEWLFIYRKLIWFDSIQMNGHFIRFGWDGKSQYISWHTAILNISALIGKHTIVSISSLKQPIHCWKVCLLEKVWWRNNKVIVKNNLNYAILTLRLLEGIFQDHWWFLKQFGSTLGTAICGASSDI